MSSLRNQPASGTTTNPEAPIADDSPLVDVAYSPDLFTSAAAIWSERMSDHFALVSAGDGPVLNWHLPHDNVRDAEGFARGARATVDHSILLERFEALIREMLSRGQNLHHPHYIGHQVPAPIPLAGLFDAVGSVTNQVMAIYEMGPWATAVEQCVIGLLMERVGWNADTSDGLLTSGGSLANLTALLTARNVVFSESWQQGTPTDAVLVCHADAHYSVTRAAGVLGLGTAAVRRASLDALRRIDADQLDEQLAALRRCGESVMAVVACACATPIGAIDPIADIADVCSRHNVWLHVDAAHAGSALFSRRHRHLLRGIDEADSVVWDAHKMLFVPALCAAVLYRDKSHRFRAFQQEAPYLFDPTDPGMAEFDSGMKTVECTKRATAFGLWGMWSMFGADLFEQMVDRTFARAAVLHSLMESTDDFEPLHVPQCNILTFRHLPEGLRSLPLETQNDFQRQLRLSLIRSGDFYIVQTQLDDMAALRVCVMNPITGEDDLHELLAALRRHGEQLL